MAHSENTPDILKISNSAITCLVKLRSLVRSRSSNVIVRSRSSNVIWWSQENAAIRLVYPLADVEVFVDDVKIMRERLTFLHVWAGPFQGSVDTASDAVPVLPPTHGGGRTGTSPPARVIADSSCPDGIRRIAAGSRGITFVRLFK